jgi:signal transduction histidine kinase/CheY-like chemotaxis protein
MTGPDRMPPATNALQERVLVLALMSRDGELAQQALTRAGIAAEVLRGVELLCEAIGEGVGAVLVTEESLTAAATQLLLKTLEREPPWSDLPIVVLTTAGQATGLGLRTIRRLGPSANVSFLERPVRTMTLVAAVRTALRARRRQYDVRDYLQTREEVQEALRVAHAEAERSSRAKDDFLAMLAHELRNPLAAIVSGLALLDSVDPHNEIDARARGVIGRQVHHLTHLVDDLLDVSRIVSGKIELERAPVDLARATRQCVEARQSLNGTHKLTMLTDARPFIVDGDTVRLEQIIGNLLDNAVKYSPPEAPIHVTLREESGQAVLRIKDHGVGVAPDMLESIFEPFTQIATSLHRGGGGLGLGLAVARGLVEQHGGSIRAESAGLGHGTEFVVRLPLSSEASVTPEETRVPEAPPRRIVVVEDHEDAREMLVELLSLQGHHVEGAGDGRTGLNLIVDSAPDIALIDVGLPELDGYEVARQVRRTMGQAVRLIAVTGYGQSYDRARAEDAGFDLHLTKPVNSRELSQALGAA